MKLQQRFVLSLSIFTIFSVVLFGLVIVNSVDRFNRTLIKNSLNAHSQLSATTVSSLFDSINADLDIISKNSTVRRYFAVGEATRYKVYYAELGRSLARYLTNNRLYDELAIVLPDGYQDIFLNSGNEPVSDFDPYIENLIGEEVEPNQRFTNIASNKQGELYLVNYIAIPLNAYAFKDSVNKVVGFVKIQVKLAELMQQLSTEQYHVKIIPSTEKSNINNLGDYEQTVIQLNDLLSLFVEVPTNIHEDVMNRLFWSSMLSSTFVVVLMSISTLVLLNYVVVRPLHRFSRLIEEVEKTTYSLRSVVYGDSSEINSLKKKFIELITRIRESSVALEAQAYTDTLTGLPNRAALYLLLETHLSKHKHKSLSILFLDLDGFKQVNDVFGHEVGDELLKVVSSRLSQIIRHDASIGIQEIHSERQDVVIRLGGDEFTILLFGESNAQLVADRILQSFQQGFQVLGKSIYAGTSIGISHYPSQSEDLSMLIQYADIAMYQAKAKGKMRAEVYSIEMAQAESKKQNLERIVREGIEYNRFTAFFQSKIDINTGELVGVEALARLYDRDDNLVSPVEFIAMAKGEGVLENITYTVMEKTGQLLEAIGHPKLVVSINIEPSQLNDLRLLADLRNIMWQYQVEPEQIEFEVTEEELITRADESKKSLELLNHFGFQTALDDFGVGYSSLGHLKNFRFDSLKLDRIFVSTEDYNSDIAIGILKAIKTLADTLGMHIVAEGIETEEQIEFIRQIGIDTVQGYLYSKPLPMDEFIKKYYPSLVD